MMSTFIDSGREGVSSLVTRVAPLSLSLPDSHCLSLSLSLSLNLVGTLSLTDSLPLSLPHPLSLTLP